MLIGVNLCFLASHWEKYNTKILYLPWGYDVSQIVSFRVTLDVQSSQFQCSFFLFFFEIKWFCNDVTMCDPVQGVKTKHANHYNNMPM